MNFRTLLSPSARIRLKNERGLTMIEILVAMVILLVIAGVSLTIWLTTNSAASRFGETTINQSEVANAVTKINADIAAASSVAYASSEAVSLISNQDNATYTVKIFYYKPGLTQPAGYTIDNSRLPNYSAIIEQRTNSTTGKTAQNILVPGFNRANQTTDLFTYYNGNNDNLGATNVQNLGAPQRLSIKRIEYYVSAKVSERTALLELGGSATPRSLDIQGLTGGSVPAVAGAPVLTGSLPEHTTTAILHWTIPAGATGYTLYRSTNGGAQELIKIFGDPATQDYNDTGLTYGNIYTYQVWATGPGGDGKSNFVPLTVVPPKVIIVNLNTTKGLGDINDGSNDGGKTSSVAQGYPYTVARDLTNQISWKPANGATGYYVYRFSDPTTANNANDTNAVYYQKLDSSTLSYRDTNVSFGNVYYYRVEAFNQGANCDAVCDGELSDTAKLVSPPSAPVINAVNLGNTQGNAYNRISITTRGGNVDGSFANGYYLFSNSQRNSDGDCSNLNNTNQQIGANQGDSVDNQVGYGTSTCYSAYGYNDAGRGAMSNTRVADQGPGAFDITRVNAQAPLSDGNGPYTVARGNTNQITWTASPGADAYRIYRDGSYIGIQLDGNTTVWSEQSNNGDTHTYQIVAVSLHGYQRGEQTISSSKVTLVSPPTTPNISAVADDSTPKGTATSINYVTVNSIGQNAAAVRLYRQQAASANPQCSTSNGQMGTMGTGTTGDYNALWGNSTCYQAVAYNDAGDSAPSNTAVADQLPGKFGYTKLENTVHYMAQWNNGMSRISTSGERATGDSNQGLRYSMEWDKSAGARKYNLLVGYNSSNPSSSARDESWKGNGHDTCGGANNAIVNAQMGSTDNADCFYDDNANLTDNTLNTTSGNAISDLSPGSFYRVLTIAVGANGQRRGVSSNFVTTATVPQYAAVYSYRRQVDNTQSSTYLSKVVNIGRQTVYGTGSQVKGYMSYNNDPSNPDSGPSDFAMKSAPLSQSTTDYMTVRASPVANDSANMVKSSLCRTVNGGYCHVFNTDYSPTNSGGTTTKDMTGFYNTDPDNPTRYKFGSLTLNYAGGATQTYMDSSDNSYNYSGYSDQLTWLTGAAQGNCWFRGCNPNDSDVTAGSNLGPWADNPVGMDAGNSDGSTHDYYWASSVQGTNPNGSDSKKGTPAGNATKNHAATQDGSLPSNGY
jgi:prepilin-type N-terminal cleavage/methylation domain-containing protein